MMTAEEQAAVEWLEELPEVEHMYHFRVPAGEASGLFSVKQDHERSLTGTCYRCRGAEKRGTLEVIE
jgi:hypothetical protein